MLPNSEAPGHLISILNAVTDLLISCNEIVLPCFEVLNGLDFCIEELV
jgi:hypothetical protein